MTTYKHYSPREAYASYMLGNVLVDVREPGEGPSKRVDVNHLVVLPLSELIARSNELPHDRTVMLVSRVGYKSLEAARLLTQNGFEDVATVEGGISAWEEDGLPLRD